MWGIGGLGEYLLDNYGVCTRGVSDKACECLRKRWLGRGCPYWKPAGAQTLDQLKEAQGVLNAAQQQADRAGSTRGDPGLRGSKGR